MRSLRPAYAPESSGASPDASHTMVPTVNTPASWSAAALRRFALLEKFGVAYDPRYIFKTGEA